MFPALHLKGAVPTHLNLTPCTSKDSLVPFPCTAQKSQARDASFKFFLSDLLSLVMSVDEYFVLVTWHCCLESNAQSSTVYHRVRRLILDEHPRVVFQDGPHLQPAMKPLKCKVSFPPVPLILSLPTGGNNQKPVALGKGHWACVSIFYVQYTTLEDALDRGAEPWVAVGLTGQAVFFECLEGLACTHCACELIPACVHGQIKPSRAESYSLRPKAFSLALLIAQRRDEALWQILNSVFLSPDWKSLP